ncbi:carotenoid oxygenase family protein [Nannocystis punicea]|uniref:Carotenoid oxygenase family protein n=1 Tax=Nannocystis punicea TaxID=2995304 RepID=A0ABY7H501_9BACT|nr:carotenoid oxygenase family protein [Nannocystis poenicansa]WAS94347.1 carotenoid oxygenase family protein [Nannocystis poenicansa]
MEIPQGPARIMPTSMLSSGAEDIDGDRRELGLIVLDGAVPADVHGHLFVAGSIASLGRPAFTGEGTLYRFDLAPGQVRLAQSIMRPPCHYADRAAASFGELMQFRDIGLSRISPLLGVRTVLSNSPIPLRDRMIVTTDAGRPWEFDPVTLELVTPIGKTDEWLGAIPVPWAFPLVLSTAHPAEDEATGELFTVNFANAAPGGRPGFSHLVRWTGRALEHFKLIDRDGEAVQIQQCVHQIQVTRNWVLIQDSAFVVEMRQLALDVLGQVLPVEPLRDLLGASTMRTQRPTTVIHAIRRRDLRPRSGGFADLPTPVLAHRIELEGESVHFYADFEDDGEHVRLIVPHTPTLDVSEWIHEGDDLLSGGEAGIEVAGMQIPCALARSRLGIHKVHVTSGEAESRFVEARETWGLALGTYAPRGREAPIEVVYYNTSGFAPELVPARLLTAYAPRVDLAALPLADGEPPRLLEIDTTTGALRSYTAPNGWSLLSPNFIPRKGGPRHARDGYVAVLAHASETVPRTHGSTGEELWLFDAADISRGPIARLGHPELDFAFTIHGSWVPTLKPSRRDYRVDIRNELDLEYIRTRALGSLAFSDIFNETLGRVMQSDDVDALLTMAVFPKF